MGGRGKATQVSGWEAWVDSAAFRRTQDRHMCTGEDNDSSVGLEEHADDV